MLRRFALIVCTGTLLLVALAKAPAGMVVVKETRSGYIVASS
jgi:hypothetical protein